MVKRAKKIQPIDKKSITQPVQSTNIQANTQITKLPEFISKHPYLVFSALLILMLVIVFKDYIFMNALFIYKDIGSDTLNTFYPQTVLRSNAVNQHLNYTFQAGMGRAMGGNTNLTYDIVSFILHPFYKLINLFWQGRDLAWGIGIMEAMKLFTGGLVFFAYLRTIRLSQVTASIGGLLFAFSGIMIGGSTWYMYCYDLIFWALLLLAFEQALIKKRYWIFLIISTATFQTISPFYSYFFGMFFVFYSLLRVISESTTIKQALGFYLRMVGIVALAVLINLPLLLPKIEYILNLPRVSGNLNKAEAMQKISIFATGDFIHNVTAVLRLFSNDILGGGRMPKEIINGQTYLTSSFKGYSNYYEAPMFYIGILPLIFFSQFLFFKKMRTRILFGIFLIIWIFPVVFPYFRRAYFLFFGDYYRLFSIFLPFAILLPALIGFDKLLTEQKINLPALWITSALFLLLLFYPYFPEKSEVVFSIQLFAGFLIILYTLLITIYKQYPSMRVYSIMALGLFMIFELVFMADKTVNDRDVVSKSEFTAKKGYNDYSIDAIEFINSQDSSFFRTEKDYSSGSAVHASMNDSYIQNYFGTTIYNSLQNPYYIAFLQNLGIIHTGNEAEARWAPGLRSRALLANMANVKYMLSKSPTPYFKGFGYDAIKTFEDVTVYKNRFFLPLGYSYDKKIKESDFNKLSSLQKDITLMQAVVLPDSNFTKISGLTEYVQPSDTLYSPVALRVDVDSLSKEAMQLTYFKQDEMRGNIHLSKKRVVFFSFLFDRNWKIYANKKLQTNLLANIGFTGIVLPAGDYSLELIYEIDNVNVFMIISNIISILLFLYFGLWLIFKEKISKFLNFKKYKIA